jgi:hypothetical protein
MVSFVPARPSERHVPGTGPVRVPERPSQARAAAPAPDDAALTLGRRIGVLVVLAALGAAIVLAATGGGGDRAPGVAVLPTPGVAGTAAPTSDPAASVVPVAGAPTGQAAFLTRSDSLVKKRRIDLRVRVPEPGVAWDGLELRVFRGGSQVSTQALAPADLNSKGRVVVRGIPLKRGQNKLTVALANAAGAGPASDTLTIQLDDQPPRLKVTAPRKGATFNHDSVVVKGRTGLSVRVIVRNVTTDQKEEVFADGEGRFEAKLDLKRGRNTLKVAVRDKAGNQNLQEFAIVRGNGRPETRLSLSRASIKRSALPRTIDARTTVLDADGLPIKGAHVVFTFAPWGQDARIRQATTSKDGTASSDFRIVADAEKGPGLVTVLVTLPDGRVLDRVTQRFTID